MKTQLLTKYIFQSGVGAVLYLRLSHHRSLLPDRNEAPKSAPQNLPPVTAKRKRPKRTLKPDYEN